MGKRQQKRKLCLGKVLFYTVMFLFLILLAWQSAVVIPAIQNALVICYRTVIPSLFPFFVFSGLLLSGGFATFCARVLSPLMQPLFRINGSGALALVIGLISGYPMGAKITAELYACGQISREEAQRLLPFCNNSGPLFIVGAVGTGMLGDEKMGLFLYGVHAFCAILVGLCFRFYKSKEIKAKNYFDLSSPISIGFLQSFTEAVNSGVNTLLLVCGYILLFAAVGACITPILEAILPSGFVLGLKSILEVTGGAFLVIGAGLSPRIMLSVVAFLIGFGGICVMMQVAGVLDKSGIGFKNYVLGKLMHGFFSGVVVYACYPFLEKEHLHVFSAFPVLPVKEPTAEHFYLFCATIFFVACILFCFLYKTKGNKRQT